MMQLYKIRFTFIAFLQRKKTEKRLSKRSRQVQILRHGTQFVRGLFYHTRYLDGAWKQCSRARIITGGKLKNGDNPSYFFLPLVPLFVLFVTLNEKLKLTKLLAINSEVKL